MTVCTENTLGDCLKKAACDAVGLSMPNILETVEKDENLFYRDYKLVCV